MCDVVSVWVVSRNGRWLGFQPVGSKLRQRGIAQFVSIAIVSFFGFICAVSATGASFSSNRASVPERLAFASDTSFSSDRHQTFQTPMQTRHARITMATHLDPAPPTVDLVVKNGTCVVNAGSYMYHNINIIKGGILQFSDANITLNAANIIIENQGTMRAGSVDANTGNITPITGPLDDSPLWRKSRAGRRWSKLQRPTRPAAFPTKTARRLAIQHVHDDVPGQL